MSQSLKTRDQLVVAALANLKERPQWGDIESRSESLSTMILRHGLIPVRLFLQSKGDQDKALCTVLDAAIKAVLQVNLDELANVPHDRYLLINEVAAEAAVLVSRWAKVQVESGKTNAQKAARQGES